MAKKISKEILEEYGQLNIFSVIEESENNNPFSEEELIKKVNKFNNKNESPIGLKTDGTNFTIDEQIEINKVTEESLSEVLNNNFNKSMEKEEMKKMDYTFYSLDDFAGSEPSFEDRLVAFDTSLLESDPKFVVVASKEDYETISDFKLDFSGNGGLNEHLIIAFPLKADKEPQEIVDLYEKKKITMTNKDIASKKIKDADAEARSIKELENDGIVSESDDEQTEVKSKRKRKPRM